QRRVAMAGGYVAQNLIIGAVFTDDHEHMLDRRRIADLGREGNWFGLRVATRGRLDILDQIPVVVLGNLLRHPLQGRVTGDGDDADGAIVLVRVVVADAIVALERIPRADAFVVGNDERVIGLVQHD